MRQRRTAEQWREILMMQKQRGLSDAQCGKEFGVDASSLIRWRGRLGLRVTPKTPSFVQLPVPAPAQELRIILPNGLVVVASLGWPVEHLAQVAGKLRSL
jgi:transposase-like protein